MRVISCLRAPFPSSKSQSLRSLLRDRATSISLMKIMHLMMDEEFCINIIVLSSYESAE